MRSLISKVPDEIRSRIEGLWIERQCSLDELVQIAGGGISRTGLHRWLRRQASDEGQLRRIRTTLLRSVAEKLRITPANELSIRDIVGLCAAFASLDRPAQQRSAAVHKKRGRQERHAA